MPSVSFAAVLNVAAPTTVALAFAFAFGGAHIAATAGQSEKPATRHELAQQLVKTRVRLAVTERRVRVLQRVVRHEPDVQEALRLASFIYRVPEQTLRSLAFCESRFNPAAVNRSSGAAGLLQFMPQTWAANYYGRHGFSVWSPYANALGAAQHISRYGTGAWECRP